MAFEEQSAKQMEETKAAMAVLREELNGSLAREKSLRESYESTIAAMQKGHAQELEVATTRCSAEAAKREQVCGSLPCVAVVPLGRDVHMVSPCQLQALRDEISDLESKLNSTLEDSKVLELKFRNSSILARGLHEELRRVRSVASSLVPHAHCVRM